ncbi:MAG: putative inorganic carbon transporter subunit DabA [Ilumatobacteraceae bacterium]
MVDRHLDRSTPVSAIVHAGLVSGAGLILLRFASPFVQSDPAVILAFGLGLLTVVLASGAVLVRCDVKGALAWSTVSQMAFMVVQCSVGALSSALFHIAGHGMYKASLFLGAGDTVSAGLRHRRRPAAPPGLAGPHRLVASAAIATLAVAVVGSAVRPDVAPAGQVLVFVFAWLTVASGTHGWLAASPFTPLTSMAVAAAGSTGLTATYVGGVRIVEHFVNPGFADVASSTVIGPLELSVALVVVVVPIVVVAVLPGELGVRGRDRARQLVVRLCATSPRISRPREADRNTITGTVFPHPPASNVQRSEIRADVSEASRVIAPQWPLASFVAVNPLGGLESLTFDDAAETARVWRGARTHLGLDEYRRDHDRGLTRAVDLGHAAHSRFPELCAEDAVVIDGRPTPVADVIVADLLHGPDLPPPARRPTALQRLGAAAASELIDEVMSSWLMSYVAPPKWPAHRPGESFTAMARRSMADDARLRPLLSAPIREWIASLGNDPASIIDAAFAVSRVPSDDRVGEARSLLCCLAGWSGLAKWRTDWALGDEERPALAPIDIVAVRALLEAGTIASGIASGSTEPKTPITLTADGQLEARVDAVARVLAPAGSDADRDAIRSVLARVPAQDRPSMWLAAQERALDARLVSMLDRLDPGQPIARPDAQLVFCIDVRSEGLRSHLEALGNVETIGFAGFFGVPMRIRKVGWEHPEARCPVLVSPAIGASEQPRHDHLQDVAAALLRERVVEGLTAAHSGAKYGPGGPFALAETAGWFTGPEAALRTFVRRASNPPAPSPTRILLDDHEVLLEQRTFFAESVLTTMGLTDRFAPLVVLCGHTSRTVNNPHATALECGACAGAAGDDNARAVAALLNSPDIRHGLAERGIDIPDGTWFGAAVHDTASDRVTLLDTADAPAEHRDRLDALRELLDQAGARQAAARAPHLPGPPARVRDRGADWAQVRPEWGLARNAAFLIGPRTMTAGIDFEGRAFLHSYDADADPTGRVLETIMTAPLVVGHWISAQYYFSTVDPEAFGAGNKLLHNPIGTTGVISGDAGDLRVGLPLQSTHVDGERFHQPVRMVAFIQADLATIERIIANNPILRTLTSGSWIRIAARSTAHERWSTRTPTGTWIETPRTFDPDPTLTPNREHP